MGLFDRTRTTDQASEVSAMDSGDGFGVQAGSGGSADSSRLYNPYEGLAPIGFDARALHEVYRLPSAPEYLFTEESKFHRRGWSENLTYYSGVGYLTGVIGGAGKGLTEGVKSKPESGIDTPKLRMNRILNATGNSGRRAGNVMGVLGLFYAVSESGINYISDGLTSDGFNAVAAGATTGSLFKLASGPRTAIVAGVLGASVAATLQAGRFLLDSI